MPLVRPVIAAVGDVPGGATVEDASYEEALVASLHSFAETGEAAYAAALLEKHPTLAGQRRKWPRLKKPDGEGQYLAIHRAARGGNMRMVQVLIEAGEKPDADGGEGWTPVHIAAKHNRVDVLRVLDRAGADLAARTREVAPQPVIGLSGPNPLLTPAVPSFSALDIAKQAGSEGAVQYLLSRGAGKRP